MNSISVRLALVLTLGFGGTLAVVLYFADASLRSSLLSEAQAHADTTAHTILLILDRTDSSAALTEEVRWEPTAHTPKTWVQVFNSDGTLLIESPGSSALKANTPLLTREFRSEPPRQWLVRVKVDLSSLEETLSVHQRTLIQVGLVASLIAGLAISATVRLSLWSLDKLTSSTELLGSRSHPPIEPKGYPQEVAPLAQALLRLHEAVQEQFLRRERFAENLAHEARTPLHQIQGRIEVTLSRKRTVEEYQAALASISESTSALSQLVDSLLFLARAEKDSESTSFDHVDANQWIQSVFEDYRPLAEEAQLELVLIESGSTQPFPLLTTMRANVALMNRAMSNLLMNAIQHGRPGAKIFLSLTRSNHAVVIEVQDEGPAIPSEDHERIFERFFRKDRSRQRNVGSPSTGLGLAIVKAIAELHHGRVSVKVSRTPVGTEGNCFELQIPLVLKHETTA